MKFYWSLYRRLCVLSISWSGPAAAVAWKYRDKPGPLAPLPFPTLPFPSPFLSRPFPSAPVPSLPFLPFARPFIFLALCSLHIAVADSGASFEADMLLLFCWGSQGMNLHSLYCPAAPRTSSGVPPWLCAALRCSAGSIVAWRGGLGASCVGKTSNSLGLLGVAF